MVCSELRRRLLRYLLCRRILSFEIEVEVISHREHVLQRAFGVNCGGFVPKRVNKVLWGRES